MSTSNAENIAEVLSNTLRLKTFPVAVKFLDDESGLPAKTRKPSEAMGKKITICQAMTLARIYGWTVGLTKEDLICLPAMLAFGFSGAADPADTLERLFCDISFAKDRESAKYEVETISRFENDECRAIVMAPLAKNLFTPDTIVFYGNPAQMMRLIQAMVFEKQRRIAGNFGGKVECSEYLIAPFKSLAPRISLPGMGDRIFSMTQDDEMVFSIPGRLLEELVTGIKESGKTIGARYPVTVYQNFQPEFPRQHLDIARELGLF